MSQTLWSADPVIIINNRYNAASLQNISHKTLLVQNHIITKRINVSISIIFNIVIIKYASSQT